MPSNPRSRTPRLAALATAALLSFPLALPSTEARAESLRCGGRLALPKMTSFEVQQICGAPNELRRREALISRTRVIQRRIATPGVAPGFALVTDAETYTTPLEVEEWIYMQSPGDLTRLLIFEGGQLVTIRVLGRVSEYSAKAGHVLDDLPPHVPAHEQRPIP